MNTLALRLPLTAKKIPLRLNLKGFWILSAFLLSTSLLLYLFQITILASTTFLIKDYQKKITETSRDNSNLEINLAKQNSLANIGILVKNLDFEKIDKVRYLQLLEGQVVAK